MRMKYTPDEHEKIATWRLAETAAGRQAPTAEESPKRGLPAGV